MEINSRAYYLSSFGAFLTPGVSRNCGAIGSGSAGILAPDALARAAKAGLSARKLLANNDGYSFFEALDDLVVTGPTRTNVNDYRVILMR